MNLNCDKRDTCVNFDKLSPMCMESGLHKCVERFKQIDWGEGIQLAVSIAQKEYQRWVDSAGENINRESFEAENVYNESIRKLKKEESMEKKCETCTYDDLDICQGPCFACHEYSAWELEKGCQNCNDGPSSMACSGERSCVGNSMWNSKTEKNCETCGNCEGGIECVPGGVSRGICTRWKPEEKKCETCAHEKDDSCSELTCGGVYPSLWEPKKEEREMEKKCSNCGRCGAPDCHVNACYEYEKWEPETPKTYKQLKPISLEALWNAQTDHECAEFLAEWAVFMNTVIRTDSNVNFSAKWNSRMYRLFMRVINGHFHGPTWIGFMERHGFIEEENVKPPLGITPRFINDEKRHDEISLAITRYVSANKEFPAEWRDEYNEIFERLRHTEAGKGEQKRTETMVSPHNESGIIAAAREMKKYMEAVDKYNLDNIQDGHGQSHKRYMSDSFFSGFYAGRNYERDKRR